MSRNNDTDLSPEEQQQLLAEARANGYRAGQQVGREHGYTTGYQKGISGGVLSTADTLVTLRKALQGIVVKSDSGELRPPPEQPDENDAPLRPSANPLPKYKPQRKPKAPDWSKDPTTQALMTAVTKTPHDLGARSALSDHLEENDAHHDPMTLHLLANHDGPVYVGTHKGKVWAGEHAPFTWDEVRNKADHPDNTVSLMAHPDAMVDRGYGLHNEVNGPSGNYLILSAPGAYHPTLGETRDYGIVQRTNDPRNHFESVEKDGYELFDSLDDARKHAHTLAFAPRALPTDTEHKAFRRFLKAREMPDLDAAMDRPSVQQIIDSNPHEERGKALRSASHISHQDLKDHLMKVAGKGDLSKKSPNDLRSMIVAHHRREELTSHTAPATTPTPAPTTKPKRGGKKQQAPADVAPTPKATGVQPFVTHAYHHLEPADSAEIMQLIRGKRASSPGTHNQIVNAVVRKLRGKLPPDIAHSLMNATPQEVKPLIALMRDDAAAAAPKTLTPKPSTPKQATPRNPANHYPDVSLEPTGPAEYAPTPVPSQPQRGADFTPPPLQSKIVTRDDGTKFVHAYPHEGSPIEDRLTWAQDHERDRIPYLYRVGRALIQGGYQPAMSVRMDPPNTEGMTPYQAHQAKQNYDTKRQELMAHQALHDLAGGKLFAERPELYDKVMADTHVLNQGAESMHGALNADEIERLVKMKMAHVGSLKGQPLYHHLRIKDNDIGVMQKEFPNRDFHGVTPEVMQNIPKRGEGLPKPGTGKKSLGSFLRRITGGKQTDPEQTVPNSPNHVPQSQQTDTGVDIPDTPSSSAQTPERVQAAKEYFAKVQSYKDKLKSEAPATLSAPTPPPPPPPPSTLKPPTQTKMRPSHVAAMDAIMGPVEKHNTKELQDLAAGLGIEDARSMEHHDLLNTLNDHNERVLGIVAPDGTYSRTGIIAHHSAERDRLDAQSTALRRYADHLQSLHDQIESNPDHPHNNYETLRYIKNAIRISRRKAEQHRAEAYEHRRTMRWHETGPDDEPEVEQ